MLTKNTFGAGVVKDDTEYASAPYAIDSDQIRFVRGKPETLGGYQDVLGGVLLKGKGRGLHAWSDTKGISRLAVATHRKLYIEQDNISYDITPLRAVGEGTATAAGNTVEVTDNEHGAHIGDTIYIKTRASNDIGRGGAFDNDAFYSGGGTTLVSVSMVNHGFVSGSLVDITGVAVFNGITIDGQYSLTVVDDDHFTIFSDTPATASGFGGGSSASYSYYEECVVTLATTNTFTVTTQNDVSLSGSLVDLKYELPSGNENGSAVGGYSLGGYSTGSYGYSTDPKTRSEVLPRTWSLDNIGQFLIANPLGLGIYIWRLNLSKRAIIIPNAPKTVDFMIVTAQGAVMAFGCEGADGVQPYDPLRIRSSELQNYSIGIPWEVWVPNPKNLCFEGRLSVGSAIIGARKTNSGVVAWTENALHFGTYTGATTGTYRFDHVASGCGLAGPNAAVERDGICYWYSPEIGFYKYNSGAPDVIPCPVRDFVVDSIDTLQNFKIYAAFDGKYNGLLFFYPSNSDEVNRYVRLDINEQTAANGGWSVGTTEFTAWLDRGTLPYPRAVRSDGMLVDHERGLSANGAPIKRFIEYAPVELETDLGPGGRMMYHSQVIFDAEIAGDVQLTVKLRTYPNSAPTEKGPFTLDSSTKFKKFRGKGRQAGYRLESEGIADKWRLGNTRFDVDEGPMR